jgi:cyanophycinase-like exopeptidase
MVYSYLGTKTERALHELLDLGGAVGGESAGATIQASWLDSTDEEFTPEIRASIQTYGGGGFGLPTRAAAFPPFDKRGSMAAVKFDAEHPDRFGIGIGEETGLIVPRSVLRFIGQGTVSIYDERCRRVVNQSYSAVAIVIASPPTSDLCACVEPPGPPRRLERIVHYAENAHAGVDWGQYPNAALHLT